MRAVEGIRAQQTPDHRDLINAPGVYLILEVQVGAFDRQEAFFRS